MYKRYRYEEFLENFMDMDVTEIPGADNLFDACGIIADVQHRYARLYGAKRSWLVVGGTSASLMASIMAVLEQYQCRKAADGHAAESEKGISEEDTAPKLIMARNCHKSVFNGLALAGGQPVYAYPEMIGEYGIAGEVTADEIKRCISEHPDAAAVLVTSPNYYGICSDIAAISKVVHDAGMTLIVDQAHGAHLKFFHKYGCGSLMLGSDKSSVGSHLKNRYDIPMAAEDQGADLVANSTHKTLASMTQSAVLNLCSDRVDPEIIEEKLQMIESSSPSYILMTSLDINAELLEEHGRELISSWRDDLEWFYSEAARVPGMKLMGNGCIGSDPEAKEPDADNGWCTDASIDLTKLNIDLGIPGHQLEQMLNEKGIFPELYAGNVLMCMTGIGNVRSDYEKLLTELENISAVQLMCRKEHTCKDSSCTNIKKTTGQRSSSGNIALPSPGRLRAVPKRKIKVPLIEAEGCICASSIIPYPPGSPIVCPGEEITGEMIQYLERLRCEGHKLIGIDANGMIFVGDEQQRMRK